MKECAGYVGMERWKRSSILLLLCSIITNQGDLELAYQRPGISIPEGSSRRYSKAGRESDAIKGQTVERRDNDTTSPTV